MDLAHVLWIGGVEGSGRQAVARTLAERFDLGLYSVGDHDEAHGLRMPRLPVDGTLDGVMKASRHRFRLVLEDLAALPEAATLIVEGAQLFPTSVAAVLREQDQALFMLRADADDASRRIGWEARDLRLVTLSADAPPEELAEQAAGHFRPVLELLAQRRSR